MPRLRRSLAWLSFVRDPLWLRRCGGRGSAGDFGFWPKWRDFLEQGRDLLEETGLPLYFVEGNHEDYGRLPETPPEAGPFRLVFPPGEPGGAGTGTSCAAPAGAGRGCASSVSATATRSTSSCAPGIDWFLQETVSDEQVVQILGDPPSGRHLRFPRGAAPGAASARARSDLQGASRLTIAQ
jgi:hypothetical protein